MQKKIVVFDTFELVYGYGKSIGIYNYSLSLFSGLAVSVPENIQLVLVCNSINSIHFCRQVARKDIMVQCIQIKKMSSLKKILWEWVGAVKTIKKFYADIYFSPKGFVPGIFRKPKRCRTLTTIHDLIPLWYQYRGLGRGIPEKYVTWALLRSIRWSDRIIAVSRATSEEIRKNGGKSETISVIHNGLDGVENTNEESIYDFEYMFSVGSSLPHKNMEVLIEAYSIYEKMETDPVRLVICGNVRTRDNIIKIENISKGNLRNIYGNARCFIFPSLIEGFGFPSLEAMQYGIPVIAADTAINKEILGDACLFFDPESPVDLSKKMRELLSDHSRQKRIGARGKEMANKYTWEKCVRKTWEVIQSL